MGLIEQLKGQKVYLDTNIFIYIFEGYQQYKLLSEAFIEAIINNDIECYTSEITLAELLVPAFKKEKIQHISKYTAMLNDINFITLIPTTQNIYIKAALFRAKFNLKLPDAIHIASANAVDCDIFLTNDKGIKTPKNLKSLLWESL